MTFTPPFVTALTAGVLLFMQTALMLNVAATRRQSRQSLGDGGNDRLLRAIRRHGNLAENAALFIAGFALLELTGGARKSLAIMCVAFVVGRVSHAIGLSMKKTFNAARVGGIVLTAIVGTGLGWRLVSSAISHLLS
jgi:uncharacterized membrane protein YecN with MAPEG domain